VFRIDLAIEALSYDQFNPDASLKGVRGSPIMMSWTMTNVGRKIKLRIRIAKHGANAGQKT
jgi:hypothetical protein